MDSDGDGVGDNSDAFPEDASEWMDSDGDETGDNTDAFPENPEMTEQQSPIPALALLAAFGILLGYTAGSRSRNG